MKTYDYIVIGSGFGGAVSAMRLAEKGYRVLVLEQGRRWQNTDFPKSNWNIRKFLWVPILKCFGIQKVSFFNEAMVLSGTGVGGGSLVYANTHMEPDEKFFQNSAWVKWGDWQKKLWPHYQTAKKMLGTTLNPHLDYEDKVLQQIAKEMNRGESFKQVPVGIYFGDPEKPTDPYFQGQGPLRTGCKLCAGCMVGCRFDGKNTLDKNYLFFAEKYGAEILPLSKVDQIKYVDGKYILRTRQTGSWFFPNRRRYQSQGVVVSAGVLGTLELLFQQKQKNLPRLSNCLGENLRTNSESLCGVVGAQEKLNHGIAISSVFDADESTHIEICKYPDNSGLMGRLATFAAGDGTIPVRIIKAIWAALCSPKAFLKFLFDFRFAQNAIILLVMQNLDNSMRMVYRRGLFGWGMKMLNHSQDRVPSYIAKGQEVMSRFAKKVRGQPVNAISEIALNLSSTAHILGGCPMGASAEEGVVNERFEVHGYPQMMILDGSIIPCNLGVNPSLTITALAEYAMSLLPEKNVPSK